MHVSQQRVKILLAIHGWSAVCLGLLLYVVIVTGVASVFAPEITDWSSPLATRPQAELPSGLDAAVKSVAKQVDPKYRDEMFVFAQAGGRLRTFFHTHEVHPWRGEIEDIGVEFDLDPRTFEILDRREGWGEDINRQDEANALADFLVELHVRLHVPDPWGSLLTGLLGLAMLVAAVTGFIVHRHLLRELFTLRRNRKALLAKRDTHVVAGSWNLPFIFVLAFTGSYFSFAVAFGFPMMALVAFGGDEEKLFKTLVGNPPAEDARPAPVADLDAIVADTRARSGGVPNFLMVEHWGRADARVTLFTEPPQGKLTSPSYVYGSVHGEFRYEKPELGLVPSAGGTLSALMAPLHFGHFAGVWSKAVWFALGFASAYVTIAGLLLWCERRREAPGWRRLERAAYWVGYGLPLALVAGTYGFFPARVLNADVPATTMAVFLSVAGASLLLTLFVPQIARVRSVLLGLSGVSLLGLPALRWLCEGTSWAQAWSADLYTVLALDLAFAFAGALCLRAAIAAHSSITALRLHAV